MINLFSTIHNKIASGKGCDYSMELSFLLSSLFCFRRVKNIVNNYGAKASNV